jgi:hypothetical protein
MLRDATPVQARLILAALVVIAFAALIWLEWRYKTAVEESYPPFH